MKIEVFIFVQIILKEIYGKAYYADSRDKTLFYSIHRFNHFPINFKIIKYDWRIYAKNRKEKVKLKT